MTPYETCCTPGTGITGLPNSIRLPVTPENRSYLKILRKDEEERWKTTSVPKAVSSTRLPSGKGSNAEAWLMRFVGAISLATVGYAVLDSTRLVESWSAFTGWVKFAIGA